MDVINQRRLLTATAASLIAGTLGAAAWSLSSLPESSEADLRVRPRKLNAPSTTAADNELAIDPDVLRLALRQPLDDPEPPPPKPQPSPPPRVVRDPQPKPGPELDFTVLGTVIDSTRRLAIIADPSGNFDIKGVGQALDLSPAGVMVQNIEGDEVTLVHNDRSSTLRIDKKRRRVKSQNRRGRIR
jgi:hypothetical protein